MRSDFPYSLSRESVNILCFLIPTNCCLLRCSHCFAESIEYDPETLMRQYSSFRQSLDFFFGTVPEEIRHSFRWFFAIQGGEPLLLGVSMLKELIEYLKDFFPEAEISIYSNLLILKDEFVQLFKDKNIRTVKTSFDIYYRKYNAFQLAQWMNAVNNLVTSGFNVEVNVVVDRQFSMNDVKLVLEFLKFSGIKTIHFSTLSPEGRAKYFKKNIPSLDDYFKFLSLIYRKYGNEFCGIVIEPLNSLCEGLRSGRFPFSFTMCIGYEKHISVDGETYFSNSNRSAWIGNVLEDTFSDVFKRGMQKIMLHRLKYSGCRYASICTGIRETCFYRPFSVIECQGEGIRELYESITGKKDVFSFN